MTTTQPQDKSVGAALALTFFFGSLGHFYLDTKRGWWFGVGGLILCVITLGLAAIIVWPVSMIWGAVDASKRHSAYEAWLHNR